MVCASEDPEHEGLCGRSGFCTVNVLWVRVRDALSSALDSVTLADLTRPRSAAHPFHAGTSADPVPAPAAAH
jgi:DNA-binding IscR family transcriptional regulator